MTRSVPADARFEPEFVAGLKHVFEEKIAFNKVMGVKLSVIEPARVAGYIEMRPELVGHFVHKQLHGGVISACLDALGGIAVLAAIGAKSRCHLVGSTAWASSHSRSRLAVAPTTLALGAADRKMQRALPNSRM